MSIVQSIQAQLDNEHFVADAFINLKETFDTADHKFLTEKLEYYGVRDCKGLVFIVCQQQKAIC